MNAGLLGFHGLREMITIHPLFVHFPVALLIASGFFYCLGAALKTDGLLQAGRWTLYTGAVFAGLAAWTGLKAAGRVEHNLEVHEIMTLHQSLAWVVLALSVSLCAFTFAAKSAVPAKGRWAFLAGTLVLAAVVAQTADLGGRMVFLNGVGVGRKSMAPPNRHDPPVHEGPSEAVHDHAAHSH